MEVENLFQFRTFGLVALVTRIKRSLSFGSVLRLLTKSGVYVERRLVRGYMSFESGPGNVGAGFVAIKPLPTAALGP